MKNVLKSCRNALWSIYSVLTKFVFFVFWLRSFCTVKKKLTNAKTKYTKMKKIINCTFLIMALLSSQAYAAKAECVIEYHSESVSTKKVEGGYLVTIAPTATIHHRDKTKTEHTYSSPIKHFFTNEEYKEDAIVNELVNADVYAADYNFMLEMEKIIESCHS